MKNRQSSSGASKIGVRSAAPQPVTTQPGRSRRIFLCGDVMTGRGIDQILPHPGDPTLREPAADARSYVTCAEEASGPIPRPADFAWPRGEALSLVDEFAPDVRLINLETTITAGGEFAPRKSVHYRMHPDNLACLTAIRPDACAPANNHILDFGPAASSTPFTHFAGLKSSVWAPGSIPNMRNAPRC